MHILTDGNTTHVHCSDYSSLPSSPPLPSPPFHLLPSPPLPFIFPCPPLPSLSSSPALPSPLCWQEREKPPPDDLHGLRFHCWVLVLAGKREVPLSFFIEPTTSKTYSTDHEEYLGIESLWNHRNYWVNMQDCAEGVKVRCVGVWGVSVACGSLSV